MNDLPCEWREFKLTNLFSYERGTRLTKNDRVKGKYPLVTAGEQNQGVKEYISNENQKVFRNAITIDMFCNAFVHIEDFCCDDNILVLTAKQSISKYAMQFISAVINKDKEKWGYGKQYRQNSLEKHSIFLPSNEANNPNFALMENFIKNIQKEHTLKLLKFYEVLKANGGGGVKFTIKAYKKYLSSQHICHTERSEVSQSKTHNRDISLNAQYDNVDISAFSKPQYDNYAPQWREFRIGDLFSVTSNPQLNKDSFIFRENGEYPYFTRTVANNGISGYVEYLDEEHKIKGGGLAVGMLGMQFFYMDRDFYAGQFTKTCYPKFEFFNQKIAQFFIAWLNKNQAIFQGVLVRDFEKVFNNTKIQLPTNDKGQIDFAFMESFISAIQKEVIKSVNIWKQKRIDTTKEIVENHR